MAVTKIWDIKGRVDQVIGYVMNPQKTMAEMPSFHALEDVINYTSDGSKTEQPRSQFRMLKNEACLTVPKKRSSAILTSQTAAT